jgi:hypothetical protein
MDGAPPGFLVAFLLPFHIGGGAALGIALRKVFQNGFSLSNLVTNGFLILWGILFGGIPLAFGLEWETSWLFALQLTVFLGTVAVAGLAYEWLRDLYSVPGMWVASFGFVFFVIGAAVAASLLIDGQPSGLLFGLVFGGVGGTLALAGIWMLWRG